ncbi:kinesin-like protein KIF22 [Morone saxatilis]|uniref:kinesin-like protein KIF22 n=1 Tax=Morone saxatilis TaxID=34816 RepID=UPI0015E1DF59|nr:kinesin-like protein KIF22 [Morone saxatilis]
MAQRVALPDGGNNKKTTRVRVAVRLRPCMGKQDEKDEGPCVRGLDSQNVEIVNWRNATESVKYHFDAFHGEQTTQQEVFLSSVKPILPHILNGQNASVFAYGPTGAGMLVAVFFVTELVCVVRSQRALPQRQQTGKLYLVDLAGSEDNRRTGNQGIRLKESGAINLSLFTLSKVVDSLNSGTAIRVPYRDSKLTRLLQDSLGGSAHSVMITNIAPEYKYYFDTFSALNFAAKSKLIVNKPFTRETVALPVLPVKRAREDHEARGSGTEPQKKRQKDERKSEQDGSSPSAHFNSLSEPSVMDRLIALEKLMMNCQDKDRLGMLKDVAQSRKEIQELKEKQKEFESKAMQFSHLTGEKSSAKQEPAFKNNTAPLHRKPSTATKPNKQQAVVQPLQVSQLQPLQQLAVVKKQSVCVKKKGRKLSDQVEPPDGKENVMETGWEFQLDTSVLEQSRQKILQVLNTGCLKDLKGLQQIGDKKAKLILGWREIHGHFTKLEDLGKVEGMTEKRFSSFMKANILSAMGK